MQFTEQGKYLLDLGVQCECECDDEDEKAVTNEIDSTGLNSIIIQQEYYHMQGTDFTQQFSSLKIESVTKNINQTVKKLTTSPH